MINATSSSLPSSAAGFGAAASEANSSALSSDFNTFLKMLTAQARYQDPMDPIDSSAYAAQLAQFSMVEQQVKTNDALAALYGQNSENSVASLASWVGMEARAVAPAYFDGGPITVSPNPAAVSDRVDLVVYDKDGNEVQRTTVPISAEPIEWTGVDENGDLFSEGTYSFKIESFKDDELILNEMAEVYGEVAEAQLQNGQVVLIMEGGQAILSTSVTGLRAADRG